MAKQAATKKTAEKTEVEKTAEQLVDETNTELNAMPTVGDVQLEDESSDLQDLRDSLNGPTEKYSTAQATGFGEVDSHEEEFCQLFGIQACSQVQLDAIAKAKRLLDASPVVTIAALLSGTTNLPDEE